jgi:hypothetical protein
MDLNSGIFSNKDDLDTHYPGIIYQEDNITNVKIFDEKIIPFCNKSIISFSNINIPNIVIGRTENGFITFYDNQITNMKFNTDGIKSIIFKPFYIFPKNGLSENKDYNFNTITCHFPNLQKWVNKKDSFDLNIDFKDSNTNISHELPEPIKTSFNGFCLSLKFEVKKPSLGFFKNEFTITQLVNLSLDFNRRKHFKKLLSEVDFIKKFFELILHISLNTTEYIVKKSRPDPNNFQSSNLIINRNNKRQIEVKTPSDFFIKYHEIKNDYHSIVSNWMNKKDKILQFIQPLSNTFREQAFRIDTFLNIMKAMEAYHRVVFSKRDYNQQDRYEEVFESVRSLFNPSLKIRSKTAFCTEIKDLRNDYTHHNPNISLSKTDFRKLYNRYLKVKAILTCAIFKFIGIDNQIIKKSFENCNYYSMIKK